MKDSVSGFTGIVVARTEWLHQCVRVTIQPPVDKEGKIPEAQSFDEPSVIVVKAAAVERPELKVERPVKTGGWQNDRAALRR